MELSGVENQNEFFTQHYLSEVLEKDLKDRFKDWMKREVNPVKQFQAQRQFFIQTKGQLEKVKREERRYLLQNEFVIELVKSLGYQPEKYWQELDDQSVVPLLAVEESAGAPWLWIVQSYR